MKISIILQSAISNETMLKELFGIFILAAALVFREMIIIETL